MQRGLLLLLLLPHAACLVLPGPLRQVYYDWVALNARSTTRHIMKPLTTAGREELLPGFDGTGGMSLLNNLHYINVLLYQFYPSHSQLKM